MTPIHRSTASAAAVMTVGLYAATVAVLCLALRWFLVTTTGLQVSASILSLLGALLGAMAAPPLRVPLTRRDEEGRGTLVVLVSMVLAAAIVTVLGLAVLAPAMAASLAAHAVQVRPTRRQQLSSWLMLLSTSAVALGCQILGWVDGLIEPSHSAVLMVGLLLVVVFPLISNTADNSRRSQEAAQAVEVMRRGHLEDLERQALHDGLTGLLNRQGLAAPLAQAASSARHGALTGVLFVDLDGFKAVNDVHGHAAGDELLAQMGRRLQRALRSGDAAARLGGDEFVAVLPNLADSEQVQQVVDRVRAELEDNVYLDDGTQLRVGASIGVALTAQPRTVHALLSDADTKMYDAKNARRRVSSGTAGT